MAIARISKAVLGEPFEQIRFQAGIILAGKCIRIVPLDTYHDTANVIVYLSILTALAFFSRYTQFSEFQGGDKPSSGHKHTPPVTRVMIEKEQMTQKQ